MEFYSSLEWRSLRYRALLHYGKSCMLCNAKNVELHVDHIKPVSKYPELKLSFDNLQILCKDCNLGKSNTDETDFRPEELKNKTPPKAPKIIKISSQSSNTQFLVKKNIQHVYNNKNTFCRLFNNNNLRSNYLIQNNPDNNLRFCKICLFKWKKSK